MAGSELNALHTHKATMVGHSEHTTKKKKDVRKIGVCY